jgi:hypothetical protein
MGKNQVGRHIIAALMGARRSSQWLPSRVCDAALQGQIVCHPDGVEGEWWRPSRSCQRNSLSPAGLRLLRPEPAAVRGAISRSASEPHPHSLCSYVVLVVLRQTPVCSPEGVLFDILNLFPYVQKVSVRRGTRWGAGDPVSAMQ